MCNFDSPPVLKMEFLFSFSVLLCAILFTYFSFHHLNHKRKLPSSEPQLPPGSRGWPFLGETLEYFTNLRNGLPDKFVSERMNKHSSKVFRTWLIGQPMAILCGVEGNKFLFSNENKLVQAWWPTTIDKIFPKSTQKTTKDDFVRVRRILHSFLKADGLQKYVGTMDEVMKLCLQRDWKGRNREIKVGSAVKKYTFALSCKVFLGIELDSERVEKLVKPTEDIAAGSVSIPINLPGTALNRAIKSSKVMRGEIEEMIKERRVDVTEKRVSPKQDMLSHMLLLSEGDENGNFMSEADIASHIAGLLHAGYDTLNSPLTFIMKYLAELPHVYHEVLKEQMEIAKSKAPKELLNWEDVRKMKYSWNVASEVLRIMPPGVGAFREAITDFTYGGYLIPRGLKLHWVAHMTHKDPKYFPDPEKFDPSRFEGNGPPPYTYVPFGAGPRMCPGNEYARLVILVFIHNVVTNFRWEKLLPNEKVVSDPLPRPTQGLPIRLHPLQP